MHLKSTPEWFQDHRLYKMRCILFFLNASHQTAAYISVCPALHRETKVKRNCSITKRSGDKPLLKPLIKILSKCNFIFNISAKFFDLDPFLLHGITIPNGHAAVFKRIEIIGNADRRTDLILAAIAFTN